MSKLELYKRGRKRQGCNVCGGTKNILIYSSILTGTICTECIKKVMTDNREIITSSNDVIHAREEALLLGRHPFGYLIRTALLDIYDRYIARLESIEMDDTKAVITLSCLYRNKPNKIKITTGYFDNFKSVKYTIYDNNNTKLVRQFVEYEYEKAYILKHD